MRESVNFKRKIVRRLILYAAVAAVCIAHTVYYKAVYGDSFLSPGDLSLTVHIYIQAYVTRPFMLVPVLAGVVTLLIYFIGKPVSALARRISLGLSVLYVLFYIFMVLFGSVNGFTLLLFPSGELNSLLSIPLALAFYPKQAPEEL